MDHSVPFKKANLHPIELLHEAKALVGDQYWLFVGITLVGMLLGSVVAIILMGPMMCGIYLCFKQRRGGKTVDFNVLFQGFDYFAESLIATLIITGIMMLVIIPMYIAVAVVMFAGMAAGGGGDPSPVTMLLMIALPLGFGLILMMIQIPFVFVYPLIVEHNLKAIPAIKTSYAAGMANFGGILGMTLVFAFISIVASCMCIVPVYLFAPLSLGATYLAHYKVFGDPAPLEAELV